MAKATITIHGIDHEVDIPDDIALKIVDESSKTFVFEDKTTYALSTTNSYELPFFIGKGLADDEYRLRCLVVNAEYTAEIVESQGGYQQIIFKTNAAWGQSSK